MILRYVNIYTHKQTNTILLFIFLIFTCSSFYLRHNVKWEKESLISWVVPFSKYSSVCVCVKCGCKKKVPKIIANAIHSNTIHITHIVQRLKEWNKTKPNRISHNNNKIESNDRIIRICIFVMILCVCVFLLRLSEKSVLFEIDWAISHIHKQAAWILTLNNMYENWIFRISRSLRFHRIMIWQFTHVPDEILLDRIALTHPFSVHFFS